MINMENMQLHIKYYKFNEHDPCTVYFLIEDKDCEICCEGKCSLMRSKYYIRNMFT